MKNTTKATKSSILCPIILLTILCDLHFADGLNSLPHELRLPPPPPQESRALTAETRLRFISATISEGTDSTGSKTVSVEIRDKEGREAPTTVQYANRTHGLVALYCLDDDKMAVHGTLSSGGDILSIIDMTAGKLIDTIWGLNASFSPNSKMVAYKFRFPPHAPQNYATDVLLLYDLSKSVQANSMDETIGSPTNRGFIIYPESNRLARRYFIPSKNDNEIRHFTSPIVWNGKSDHLCFLDSISGKTYLVVADISKGLESPTIWRKELDRTGFYSDYYKAQQRAVKVDEAGPSLINAKRLRFIENDNAVEITSFYGGPYEERTVRVPLNSR